ncbi:MAG: choice-of-anchor D domain-containing protein [Myxococcota bacterium]
MLVFTQSRTALALAVALATAALASCGDGNGGFKLGPEAQIDIFPTVISFPDVPRGQVARKNVTVRHIGSSGVIKLAAELETTSSDLTIGLIEKTELQPGEETRIQIVYDSAHDEPDTGTLIIKHNLEGNPETDVTISTPGQRAQLFAFPGLVDFGIVQAGAPLTVDVQVRNGGSAPATLTGFTIDGDGADDFDVQVPVGTVVPVDGTVVVPMTYAPTGRDKDEAVVTLETDRPDVTLDVTVQGEEETPILTITPSLVNLGWTRPFESSGREVTLKNDGNTDLDVSSVTLEDAPSTVTLTGRPTAAFVLAPGQAFNFGVVFSPVEQHPMSGEPLAKVRVVSSDAARNPAIIQVYGAAGDPSLQVIPESVVDFAYVAEGFTAKRDVVILDVGDSPVTITDAVLTAVTSDELRFVDADSLPITLNPGQSTTLHLEFENTHGETGTESARFLIHTTDPVVPEYPLDVIARRAQRPTCEAAFVPDLLAMGAYKPGEKGRATMEVVNYGSGNCEYRDNEFDACLQRPFGISYEFVCDNQIAFNPFKLVSQPGQTAVLGPGEHLDFEFEFTAPPLRSATGRDSYYGRLFVTMFDPNSGQLEFVSPPGGVGRGVNVRAESASPLIMVDPPSIDFGLVRTDCTSTSRQVRVLATGPLDAHISAVEVVGCPASVRVTGPTLPATVRGFGQVVFELRYAPDEVVDETCQLKITNDSVNLPEALVDLAGRGTDVTHKIDHFKQLPPPKVDVLFVVDDSGSMADDQERLKQQLPSLVDIATQWGQDYHMAVTTTDTKEVRGQFKGLPRWVDNTVDPSVFAQNLVVGTAGFYIERGLQGAYLALYNRSVVTDIACQNLPNQCPGDDGEGLPLICIGGFCSGRNAGFLRDDAELVVIIISDEDDSSDQTVGFYVDRLANLKKPNTGVGVMVHAIIITPEGCPGGFGTPGYRYVSAVEAFDGHISDLCSPDFASEFEEVGQRTFGLKDRFYPTMPPDPATIQVRVKGVPCATGWSWNAASRAVIFEEGSSCYPQFDDDVDIEYDVICASPD